MTHFCKGKAAACAKPPRPTVSTIGDSPPIQLISSGVCWPNSSASTCAHARIKYLVKHQSCMVRKRPIHSARKSQHARHRSRTCMYNEKNMYVCVHACLCSYTYLRPYLCVRACEPLIA